MQTRTISSAVAVTFLIATFVAVPDLAAALADPKTRLAYIDPGSGSFILQALIAAAAGAAVAVGAYWEKLKGILGIGSSRSVEEAADEESADRESNDG